MHGSRGLYRVDIGNDSKPGVRIDLNAAKADVEGGSPMWEEILSPDALLEM